MPNSETFRFNWHRLTWSVVQAVFVITAWQMFDWRAAALCLLIGVAGYVEGKTRGARK